MFAKGCHNPFSVILFLDLLASSHHLPLVTPLLLLSDSIFPKLPPIKIDFVGHPLLTDLLFEALKPFFSLLIIFIRPIA